MKVGIIGLGQFGRFIAGTLARDDSLTVLAHDIANPKTPDNVQSADLATVAQADVVVLCVPLSAYATLLPELAPLLGEDTVVVDVASVKVAAAALLGEHLPGRKNLLLTHPMFGPLYAQDGLQGLTLVVTEVRGERAREVLDCCKETLGLVLKRMTADGHDKVMAEVHALTYYIARALTDMGIKEQPLTTPTYRMLLGLTHYDQAHSEDLFRTIELGNPYAKSAREKFVKTLQQINEQLKGEKI